LVGNMSDKALDGKENFKQKVIWITGASSGIGEALTKEFAERGARVVLSARKEPELERVSSECIAAGAATDDLLVLPLDVVDYDAMPSAVNKIMACFGRIDMLINNAGMSQRSFCIETDMSVYRAMLEVNVFGQIALTKQVLPIMLEQGSGHIAITASVAGKVGAPLRTGYCAAKHAVMGFFDALRTEVASQGIKVTTITPGFIRTNVSVNALGADGNPTGKIDDNIANGMDVTECGAVIMNGFESGIEEIAVGSGEEMGLLTLKRQDPTAAFRVLEGMAEKIRAEGGN
jgi:dehydrogenase/reductase SDR family protein 7